MLTDAEKERYSRQMLLPDWGEAGQLRLKSSSVFIAGAGGLGSAVASYLAVAGVGDIIICDPDRVETSNLNRQILHRDSMLGEPKVRSAEKTLKELNLAVRVVSYAERLDTDSVERIVGQPSIVVDCLDNFEARFALNTHCVKEGVPLIHGAVTGMRGQIIMLDPPESPCLRCLLPEVPDSSYETSASVGAAAGLVGCMQALEALKYLVGLDVSKGTLILIDAEQMLFEKIEITRRPSCPECGLL